MLSLLTQHLQTLGVAYDVEAIDAISPEDGAFAWRIHLGACPTISQPQTAVCFSVMEKAGDDYVSPSSKQRYCLGETSVLAESSDIYGVLRQSQFLLQIHGEKNARHYQASGWMMQQFGERAPAANWQLCPWDNAGGGYVVQYCARLYASRR